MNITKFAEIIVNKYLEQKKLALITYTPNGFRYEVKDKFNPITGVFKNNVLTEITWKSKDKKSILSKLTFNY